MENNSNKLNESAQEKMQKQKARFSELRVRTALMLAKSKDEWTKKWH